MLLCYSKQIKRTALILKITFNFLNIRNKQNGRDVLLAELYVLKPKTEHYQALRVKCRLLQY